MAFCQTWAPTSHIRHPWFDATVMKRKHLDTEPDADEDGSAAPPAFPHAPSASASPSPPATPRAVKRRRCSTLEHGLAHLSLGNGAGNGAPQTKTRTRAVPTAYTYSSPANDTYPRVQEVSEAQAAPLNGMNGYGAATGMGNGMVANAADNMMGQDGRASPMVVDLEMQAPPSPGSSEYSVEEAQDDVDAAPEVEARAPEVKMGVVSWYEPEPDRIVITDLDSFTQEAEEEEAEAAREKLSINEALLARIRRQRASAGASAPSHPLAAPSPTSNRNTTPSSTSQALVLFRPLPLSDMELDKVTNEEAKQKQRHRAAVEAEHRQKAEERRLFIEARDEDAMDVEP